MVKYVIYDIVMRLVILWSDMCYCFDVSNNVVRDRTMDARFPHNFVFGPSVMLTTDCKK